MVGFACMKTQSCSVFEQWQCWFPVQDPESLEIFFPKVMHCLADGSTQKWSNMSSVAWFNSMRSSQCVSVYIILEIRIFKYWRSIQCTSIVLTFFCAIITTDSSACPYVSDLILIQGNNEKVHYWGKNKLFIACVPGILRELNFIFCWQ